MTDLSNTVNKIVGSRIKSFRLSNKLNQQELANSVGLVRASVSNIELGRHQIPISTLYKFAAVLNTDVRDILPGKKEIENYIENNDIDAQLKKCVSAEAFKVISALVDSKQITT